MSRQSVMQCMCRMAVVVAFALAFGEKGQAGPISPLRVGAS
jgi:hypothetical protein